MADDTSPSFQAGSSFQSGEEQGQRSEEQSQRSEGQGQRGGRGPGNREPGGFRIRLSDNEMRAARAVHHRHYELGGLWYEHGRPKLC